MSTITSVILDVADTAAAQRFSDAAFDLGDRVRFRTAQPVTSGFRGYTLSAITSQPADALAVFDAAVAAGATVLQPARKSLWGFGGIVQAPDGAIWNIATSSKKDTAPVSKRIDEVVLLIGAEDVGASKRFYTERGLAIGRSFGSYVDFALAGSPVGLGLYKRKALAKQAGVPADGSGSHRLTIVGDLGAVTDPDGFPWEPA